MSELASLQSARHDVTVLIARDTAGRVTGGDIADHLLNGPNLIRAGRAGYMAALAGTLQRYRPDVVHTHLGGASFRAGLLNRLSLAPTMIGTLHRAFSPRAYGGHDGLICIAQWQRAGIPQGFRGSVETIANWTRSIPPLPGASQRLRAELGIGPDGVLLGAAGRFVPEKGFDTLLAAFAQAGMEDTHLVLFGDGPDRARLENLAGPRVHFPGFRKTLPHDLGGLDGFVLPSRREPFGLVLLEAMAAELPILATNAGGVPDVLGEDLSCLVPPDDVAAMAAGLRRLHDAPRRICDLTPFSPERQALRIEAFYEACIERRASRR